MPAITSLCVYCASSTPTNPTIVDATVALGRELAARDIELVYGGGAVGLMGLVADTVLDAGGRVTGIIPTDLFPREVGHVGCTELIEVGSMHERKMLMFERSDGFMALPGGLGTMEELTEMTTWAQIGIHAKPIGVVDVDGFWGGLFTLLDRAIADGVLKPSNRSLILDDPDPVVLLDRMIEAEVAAEPKWLDLDQT